MMQMKIFHVLCNLIFKSQNKNNKKEGNNKNNMDETASAKLAGFLPREMEELLSKEIGSQTVEFLGAWADLTRKSLHANKEVIYNCLVKEEDGHILCRFCNEGIPNWKNEDAREHTGDCPATQISEVLQEAKKVYKLVVDSKI